MLSDDTRREIVDHAVRWGRNMIVEVIGNHASVLSPAKRECLKEATKLLGKYETLPHG